MVNNIISNIKSSSKELASVNNLVLCSLFIAVKVVLSAYSIQVSPYLVISFSFLASAAIGLLFGPIVGGLCGGITDIISFMVRPLGPFNIVFTFLAVLSGSVFGFFLYKKEVTVTRCIITEVFMMVFINILANTYLMSVMYGKGFMALIYPRLIKNLCQLPVNVFLLYTSMTILKKIDKANSVK